MPREGTRHTPHTVNIIKRRSIPAGFEAAIQCLRDEMKETECRRERLRDVEMRCNLCWAENDIPWNTREARCDYFLVLLAFFTNICVL